MSATRAAAVAVVLVALGARHAHGGPELIPEGATGHAISPEVRTPTDALVARLHLPAGFRVTKFAEGLGKPRMLAVGPDGTVYVTRRDQGDVVALHDRDGDGRAEERESVVIDLPGVHGITLHEGRMYLATVYAVYVADMRPAGIGKPRQILSHLPPGGRHPNRTLGVGPDGKLYVTVGSTCNCCVEDSPESAAILRAPLEGGERTVFATGLRNVLGFGWHPTTHAMWGMEHGIDWLGDDRPPEELNALAEAHHYGWPFLWGDDQPLPAEYLPPDVDIEREKKRSTPPVLTYAAHAAPLQMAFYTGTQFPKDYADDAFVAMHGSWNRKPPVGYEVVRVHFHDGKPEKIDPFLTGFLSEDDGTWWTFGRPCGIAIAKDGALLVGDDTTGVVYRVAYKPPADKPPAE